MFHGLFVSYRYGQIAQFAWNHKSFRYQLIGYAVVVKGAVLIFWLNISLQTEKIKTILDFAHNGHQGATPTCLRSILETFKPYRHPWKISEACHQVHDFLPL